MGVLIAVIIITVLSLAGAVFWFLRKKKSRIRQDFLVFTGVRDIVDVRLPIVEAGRYAADDRNGETFTIRENLQVKDRETGRMVQLVCGWNCNALDVTGVRSGDLDENFLSALASRVTAESKILFDRKKQRNTVVMWVGIVCVILALGIVVPLSAKISSGDISIPSPSSILQQDMGK